MAEGYRADVTEGKYAKNLADAMLSEPYVEAVAETKLREIERGKKPDRREIHELRKIIAIEEKDKKLVRGSRFLIHELITIAEKEIKHIEDHYGYDLQHMRMLKHRFQMLHVLKGTLIDMKKHFDDIMELEYRHEDPKYITEMFIHHINRILKKADASLALVYDRLKSHEEYLTLFKRMKEKLKLLHDNLETLSADERFVLKLENRIKEF